MLLALLKKPDTDTSTDADMGQVLLALLIKPDTDTSTDADIGPGAISFAYKA